MNKTGMHDEFNASNIFKNIEITGEKLKQEFAQLAQKAQITIESQMNSAKLEAAYALSVSKEQRGKTMSEVNEVRNETWQKALQQTNRDIKNASKIYDDLCAFP